MGHGQADCAELTPYAVMADLVPGKSTYEETASLLVSKDVRFLSEASRFHEALDAVRAAMEVSPLQNPLGAMLLQHDLWERFDVLDTALRAPEGTLLPDSALASDPLLLLRDEIGILMRRLALPKADIAKIPSNLAALARAHPDLLAGLAEGKWLEVVTGSHDHKEPPGSPFREGTRHAMMTGYRAAFRRFVHIPEHSGGADWLRQALAEHPPTLRLPAGARVVLVEIPLVVSAEGDIVPMPIIDLLESRIVKPALDLNVHLKQLGFEVLEAHRALLRTPGFPKGGLRQLAYDAPFPLGGSCGPNPDTLIPMRATCVTCHGPGGEGLTGTLAHGTQTLRVSSNSDLQVGVSVATKKTRPDFAALRALFRAAE